MKKLLSILALSALGVGLAAVALVGSASAHAPYDSSTPAKGAQLTTSPSSIVINFQEIIQKTSGSYGLTLTRDGGGEIAVGGLTVTSDKQLTATINATLPAGRYVVNWNNTADDGDALTGAFSFYLNTTPTAAQLAADTALGAIEANLLLTATADTANQETATAQAAAPTQAAASTPVAPVAPAQPAATAAAPTSKLPASGSGPGGSGNARWLLGAVALTIAVAGMGLMAFGRKRTH